MKKILKLLFYSLLILSIRVKATDDHEEIYDYSSWQEKCPSGINEILIEKEVRYKWYKDRIENIRYLRKEDIGSSLVDYNDYKIDIHSDLTYVVPENYIDRVTYIKDGDYTFLSSDITNIYISNFIFKDSVYVSEIIVKNIKTNESINYTSKNELSYLSDGNTYEYKRINALGNIVLSLDKKYDISELNVDIIYKSLADNNELKFSFSVLDTYPIYKKFIGFNTCENGCTISFNESNMTPCLTVTLPLYFYEDKLYKTYEIKKVYEEEYYSYLEGYKKDETTAKEFCRYITNEYVLVNEDGNLVLDESECVKENCMMYYVIKKDVINEENNNIEEEEEVIPSNPKTYDNINIYIVRIIISFLAVTIISFLLIKNKVKICRTNKKSNYVEKI